MRGGTSKAIVFAAADLPDDSRAADRLILRAFGSPDPRQIDGLGGADSLTSKLAVVAPSARENADVDYTFGQVGIATATINYKVSCGNTAAAVGVYAVQEGLVPARNGKTPVRVFDCNRNRLIIVEVPTDNGVVVTDGDYRISGVPGTGAEIPVDFLDPAGGVTGELLPTGSAMNELDLDDGRRYHFSLVDCGNLYAILPAHDLGLKGGEPPREIESVPGVMSTVERLRRKITSQMLPNLEPDADIEARAARLKIAVVSGARAFEAPDGRSYSNDSMDVTARIINQESVHKAFAVTGAIALAAAGAIPGTTVHQLCGHRDETKQRLRIAHPQGLIACDIAAATSSSGMNISSVCIGRTARRIMDGAVYVPMGEE